MLKRQQKEQGNELVKLDDENSYPAKIKQLMEDVRFAKEKQLDLKEKLNNEKSGLARQTERINNLESVVQQANGEDYSTASGRANIGYQLDSSNYTDNADIIDKVLELEKDQAEKVQENRLLMLRYKNIQSGGDTRSLYSLPVSRDSQFNSALVLPGPTKGLVGAGSNTDLVEYGVKQNYISARGSSKKLTPLDKNYGMATIEQPRSNSVMEKMAKKNQQALTQRKASSGLPDVRIRSKSNLRSRSPLRQMQPIAKPVLAQAPYGQFDKGSVNTTRNIPLRR